MITAYWFFGDTLRDGRPVPPDGKWLEHTGPLKLRESGLHASKHPFDALKYAPGPNLALVEAEGHIVHGHDKLCASRRRVIARFDASELLRTFARKQALSVVHLWDAPQIVREYLETGNESKRSAAESAAWSAWSAAESAAWSAARAAESAAWSAWSAWSAAESAARDTFREAVEAKFAEILAEGRP